MRYRKRTAKINVKLLVILLLVTVALGVSLVAARHIRRGILSKIDLDAGLAAYEKEDWRAAARHLQEYLGRHPDDVEILKKYAHARFHIRPVEAPHIMQAIAGYRRVLQLEPYDEVASEKLATLYTGMGNFEELAYIARRRLEHDPNDKRATLWLAEALVQLNKPEEARATLTTFIERLETVPEKHVEYVRACGVMSNLEISGDSSTAHTQALDFLNKAVAYAPDSVEALAQRSRFYRLTAKGPDQSAQEQVLAVAIAGGEAGDNSENTIQERLLELARKDLESADSLGAENPKILYFLGVEWMEHSELDRVALELQAADELPEEVIEEHFLDERDWTVTKFLLSSELAIRKGDVDRCAPLADDVLAVLEERRHRARVLPSAIRLYVTAGNAAAARGCLEEYVDTIYTGESAAESRQRLAYMRALVARAEDDSYGVIDALESVAVTDASRPEYWQLLSEAFVRTDQTRRAVNALISYLRLRPRDPEMALQLAKEYLKLRDWNRAFETARLAEPLDPTEVLLKLLRIEASVYMAAEQQQGINTAKLEALSEELAQLRAKYPGRVDVRILQAIIAVHLERPEQAEKELKLAIEECEDPLRAEIQLVRHYHGTKRMTEAISTCRAACERHPEVAEPWLFLSSLHAASADYDQARGCLSEALGSVTAKWERRSVSIRHALLELTHGDRATGIGVLTELAEQDKREVRARTLLLRVREVQEDRAKTQKLIEELREAEGDSGLMWRFYQAASWLSSDGWRSQQQDIMSLLKYCIDADPEWSAPPLLLVEMYERMEDFGRVEDICRQALARNPSATEIADKLVTLLEKQGRSSEAEQVLQQIEANPRVRSAWNVRTALRAGDFSRAIAELQLRVDNDKKDANSRILLARLIYWQTRDHDQAFRYLNEAEAIVSGSLAITAAKVSILRAEGQTEEAQQLLDEYVANSSEFNAYMMRASYLANVGELERAEEDYRKLTTFPDQGVTGYVLLSNFHARNAKLDEAVATLEEGLKAYPEDLSLERRLMKVLFVRRQAQDKERALGILASLEQQLPRDPELMKFRALQLLEEQTPQSQQLAREKLEEVVKLEPTAVDAHLTLIRIAMQQKEYEAARDFAIRALGSNSGDLALLAARAKAEFALKNSPMAVELAQLILREDPNNAAARSIFTAAALSGEDQYVPTATELARRALQADPNNAGAMGAMVTISLKTTDRALLGETRALVESALRRDPTNEQLLLWRTHILVSLEQPREAIPELEAYCQTGTGSTNIDALVTLGDLYRLSEDMERADQWIERAEQVAPDSLTTIHARCVWLLAQKQFDELADISSAYLSAKDQNPSTLVKAATALAASNSMKLKEEALKLFKHVVALEADLVSARLGLASTLYQTGDIQGAKGAYEQVLERDPRNVQALNDLAWIVQGHDRRYQAALELASKGLAFDPDNVHLLDTRGTILSNIPDRLADAKGDFARSVALSPPDSPRRAKALLQLGRICAKLNDLGQARQHLEDALEIDRKVKVFTAGDHSEISSILRQGGV